MNSANMERGRVNVGGRIVVNVNERIGFSITGYNSTGPVTDAEAHLQ